MLQSIHQDILAAAQAAGTINKQAFYKRYQYFVNEQIIDIYLQALEESRTVIYNSLKEKYPKHGFIMEEGFGDAKTTKVENKNATDVFVFESLDGGNNFKIGLPYFATAITLLKNTKPEFAVVYNPILEQTYYAEKGNGAYLEANVIKANASDTDLSQAVISYTSGYMDDGIWFTKLRQMLLDHQVKRLLTNWCPTLDFCLLASGTIDCIISNDTDLFDFIGAKLIMAEAGATILDFTGSDSHDDHGSMFVAAATKTLAGKVVKEVKGM